MPIVGRIQRKPKTLYYVDAEGLIHETKGKGGKGKRKASPRASPPRPSGYAAYEHNQDWIVLSTHESKGAATLAAKSAAVPHGYRLIGPTLRDDQWHWDVVARPVAMPPVKRNAQRAQLVRELGLRPEQFGPLHPESYADSTSDLLVKAREKRAKARDYRVMRKAKAHGTGFIYVLPRSGVPGPGVRSLTLAAVGRSSLASARRLIEALPLSEKAKAPGDRLVIVRWSEPRNRWVIVPR